MQSERAIVCEHTLSLTPTQRPNPYPHAQVLWMEHGLACDAHERDDLWAPSRKDAAWGFPVVHTDRAGFPAQAVGLWGQQDWGRAS